MEFKTNMDKGQLKRIDRIVSAYPDWDIISVDSFDFDHYIFITSNKGEIVVGFTKAGKMKAPKYYN